MKYQIPASAKSWVEVPPDSHFPIQNLPIATYELADLVQVPCFRIGDFLVDVFELCEAGLVDADASYSSWEEVLFSRGIDGIRDLRMEVATLLKAESALLRDDELLRQAILKPVDQFMILPALSSNAFIDFYSGINHASNVGRMFRPDMPPLLPNYRHLPVGYNGRASSLIPSGLPVVRPNGQTKPSDSEMPVFGPTKELDFELELGFYVGDENSMGQPIRMGEVRDFMLGVVLVNDWSARDIQRWEYQPLGPFLAKSFATSVGPWMVLFDALEPFRVAGQAQEPAVLPHLAQTFPFHFDIKLQVAIKTPKMSTPQVIAKTNAQESYWSFAQQLVHQTSNGTPLEIGDLYASGTISGTEEGSFGSLLELTWRGHKPIHLSTGEERTFLEDGDELIMTGWAEGNGYRIGLGEIRTEVLPAIPY